MSRNKWYWTLQITGWTIYGIIGMLITWYFVEFNLANLSFQLFAAVTMLFTTHFLRIYIKEKKWLQLRFKALILRLIPTLVVQAFVANSLVTVYGYFLTELIPQSEFSIALFFVVYTSNICLPIALDGDIPDHLFLQKL